MSTRHQARRRHMYGPRRHELVERRVREPEPARAGRDELGADHDIEVAVAFLALGLPAQHTTPGN